MENLHAILIIMTKKKKINHEAETSLFQVQEKSLKKTVDSYVAMLT